MVHFEEDTRLLADDGDDNFLSAPLIGTDNKDFNFDEDNYEAKATHIQDKDKEVFDVNYQEPVFILQASFHRVMRSGSYSGNKRQYERNEKNGEFLP